MTDQAPRLHAARLERSPIGMLTEAGPGLTLSGAYEVQEAGIEMRLAEGEGIVGGKLGFTSRAMQSAMGVDHPNYGWLTDAMVIDNGRVPLGDLIHPKVEPEIAFLSADLDPPVSAADVLAATAALLPCLEVVDSRFVDFRFRTFDNIADNSSAAMVAVGDPVPPSGVDLPSSGSPSTRTAPSDTRPPAPPPSTIPPQPSPGWPTTLLADYGPAGSSSRAVSPAPLIFAKEPWSPPISTGSAR
jgi:2-keto-4-pentenoate hydratase